MIPRAQASQVACELFAKHDGAAWHIGIVAVRHLLDTIYGGGPTSEDEWVTRKRVDQAYRDENKEPHLWRKY